MLKKIIMIITIKKKIYWISLLNKNLLKMMKSIF